MNTTSAIVTDLPRVSQEALDALDARVHTTRLPRLVPSAAQAPGPGRARQQSLLERWRNGFDWRAIEDRVERLGYAETTTADGRRLAAIHARATDPTGLPILLVHGWPDSPLRFLELIPLLTTAGHHVVAPAIPGFWRSDEPEGEMSRDVPAADFHALMGTLGYDRYAIHAGDWGSPVAQAMAQQHPDAVVALHLTDVPFDLAYTIDKDTAGPAEVAYLEAIEKFGEKCALPHGEHDAAEPGGDRPGRHPGRPRGLAGQPVRRVVRAADRRRPRDRERRPDATHRDGAVVHAAVLRAGVELERGLGRLGRRRGLLGLECR